MQQPQQYQAQSQQYQQQQQTQVNSTFEDKLKDIESKWNSCIVDLQERMLNLSNINDLLNIIYGKRQDAVDYYYGATKMLAKYKAKYDKDYADKFKQYKLYGNENIRYTTDTQIKMQIEADLIESRMVCEIINAHIGFIKETIKNIDDIIYGINNKIRIYELLNGVKK